MSDRNQALLQILALTTERAIKSFKIWRVTCQYKPETYSYEFLGFALRHKDAVVELEVSQELIDPALGDWTRINKMCYEFAQRIDYQVSIGPRL